MPDNSSVQTDVPDQQRLFQQIASQLPSNVSLVNELAYLLDISVDSAYRRLRGETELSFSETVTLCSQYHITFDSLVDSDVQVLNFYYHTYEESLESFAHYFSGLCDELAQIRHSNEPSKHLTFIGPGIPVLHFFQNPTLNAFKTYYWLRSMNLNDERYTQFKPSQIDPQLLEIGSTIYSHYAHIPSTEIWTDSSVLGAVHQIRYCWDTGQFVTKEDALEVCEALRLLLKTIENQARRGGKNESDEGPAGASFHLYYSELEDENTCVLVEVGEQRAVYLGHLNHRFIKTANPSYALTTKGWVERLKNRSVRISESAASTSYQFFKRGMERLTELEQYIKG